MTGLAAYLSAQRIEGRIAVVGDDVLPGMYDRLLRRHTPQIEWHSDETFLLGPAVHQERPRARGVPHGGGLGHARAHCGLRVLVEGPLERRGGRAGGGHPDCALVVVFIALIFIMARTPSSTCSAWISTAITRRRPRHGDLVRAWIMGPIFQGYWMDPGRSLICGNQPTGASTRIAGRRRRGGGRLGWRPCAPA